MAKNDFSMKSPNIKPYTPSEQDKQKLDYYRKRFTDMQQARVMVDKYWDTYQTMYEAIFRPYPDERSSSVVPLANAMIELYVADAMKLETQFKFKAETDDYKQQSKALEYVWKYDWRKNKRRKCFLENEYICATYWTSVIYTWFEQTTNLQEDPIIGDNYEITFQKKQVVDNSIIVKNFDIRNFYIDDQVQWEFNEANDCIAIQYVSREKFQSFKYNNIYKNLDKVMPETYQNEFRIFLTEEEENKNCKFVKLSHYWNIEKDTYMIIANDKVLIREHPILNTMNWRKALPFVVRPFWKKNYSVYWRWLCEASMMFNSEVNKLRELLLDAIRRSNTQVLALWNWLSFDGRDFQYENEILTFNWQLWGNFQQISGNPPNQAIFSYLERIYQDIAMYVWIDIQNIIWQAQQTAFQTEVQREASQKRVNVWLVNRDMAYERFADLYKDLLQTYFPIRTAKWLLDSNKNPVSEYPKIQIEWEELRWKKFRKKKWTSVFEVTPELIRWDINIDVYTNATASTINAIDRQQKLDLMNSIASITQWYWVAKQSWVDIDSIIPIKDLLTELAEDYNVKSTKKWDQAEIQEQKAKLMEELKSFSTKASPWMWEVPMWAPEEWAIPPVL